MKKQRKTNLNTTVCARDSNPYEVKNTCWQSEDRTQSEEGNTNTCRQMAWALNLS